MNQILILSEQENEPILAALRELAERSGICSLLFSGAEIQRVGESDRVALAAACADHVAKADGKILVLSSAIHTFTPLPPCFAYVLDEQSQYPPRLLPPESAFAVTCGMSSKATVSISGKTGDGYLVSLQRKLCTLSGRVVEPHEIKVQFTGQYEDQAILAATAALLLGDWLQQEYS